MCIRDSACALSGASDASECARERTSESQQAYIAMPFIDGMPYMRMAMQAPVAPLDFIVISEDEPDAIDGWDCIFWESKHTAPCAKGFCNDAPQPIRPGLKAIPYCETHAAEIRLTIAKDKERIALDALNAVNLACVQNPKCDYRAARQAVRDAKQETASIAKRIEIDSEIAMRRARINGKNA